jgi:hypothetical protein
MEDCETGNITARNTDKTENSITASTNNFICDYDEKLKLIAYRAHIITRFWKLHFLK